MKEYIISNIYTDGYERIAEIERILDKTNFTVHFLEYDEYLENNDKPKKRKVGDVLKGDILISLVSVNKKVDKEIMHQQTVQKSSHIEAIVQIFQIVDEYSVYAFSSISNSAILVEFENMVNYKEGDKVFIEGSLELVELISIFSDFDCKVFQDGKFVD